MQFAAIFPPIRRKTFAGKAIAALKIITRARKIALFRSAPLFANPFAFGKRVKPSDSKICVPLKIGRRERNRR